jgi:hypothetical protein
VTLTYIYGREAAPNEKVVPLSTVEAALASSEAARAQAEARADEAEDREAALRRALTNIAEHRFSIPGDLPADVARLALSAPPAPALASPGETAREPMIEVPDWIPDDLGEATKAVRECASQIAFAFLQGRALAAPRSSGTPETAPFMLPQNRRAPTGTSPDLESDPRRKVCGCGAILFPDQICPCAPAPETATTARETEVPRERLALLEGLRIEAAAVARRLHGQNVVQRLAIALDLVDTVRPSWPASPSPAQEDRDA